MPLVPRCSDIIRRRAEDLIATKDSRFRLAVSCGFLISAVAVLSLGSGNSGLAQGWGGMPDLFGGGSSFFGEQPQQAPAVKPRAYQRARVVRRPRTGHVDRHPVVSRIRALKQAREAERPHHAVPPREARLTHSAAVSEAKLAHHHGAPMSLNRVSLCVRTCDGFAFPIGAYHGEQDRTRHEATCQAQCPDARTALYVLPAGADTLAEATELKSGKPYSRLPYAFHYTTVLSDACDCHAKSGGRIASLLHDYTLRRGDAVMTERGIRVFHGAARFPFRQKDFVALARTRDISKRDRPLFRAIEKASLTSPSRFASTPVALEHQASR